MSYRLSIPVKPLIWVEGSSQLLTFRVVVSLFRVLGARRDSKIELTFPFFLRSLVTAAVENHRGSRVEYIVKVRAQFKRRSTANNVEILVPVPDDADSPKFRVSSFPFSSLLPPVRRAD